MPVNIASNEVEIGDNGIRVYNKATMWKDMVFDLFSKRINGTTGKVDYDWSNNAIKFQPGGSFSNTVDRIQGNQEINHEFLVGDNIVFRPHIHWFQPVSSDVLDTTARVFDLKWRIVRNNYGINLGTPDWTTISTTTGTTNDIFDNTNINGEDYFGQITRFPDITVNCSISDTIQMQMIRSDALSGDTLVYFFDLHGEVDSLGSDAEITKTY